MIRSIVAVKTAAWTATGSVLLAALALSSCATPPPPPPPPPAKTAFKMYEWKGDGITGPASVSIYLDQQKAHFYRSGKEVGWTFVATGRSGHETPSGSFR